MINVYFIFEGQSINNCLLTYEAFMCQKRDLEFLNAIKTLEKTSTLLPPSMIWLSNHISTIYLILKYLLFMYVIPINNKWKNKNLATL